MTRTMRSVSTPGTHGPPRREVLKATGAVGALIGLGGLAACEGSSNPSPSSGGNSAGRGETITVTGISSFGQMKPLMQDFTQQTGIKVDLRILPYDQLRQNSIADFASHGARSDVYTQDIVWLGEWATNKYSRRLDDLMTRDASKMNISDILPGALESLSKWEGGTWSLPWGAYYFLMYYRKDWLREKGLQPPVTFADYETLVPALTDPSKNRYGIVMPYQAGAPISDWFLATYSGAGGKVLADPPKNFTPQLDSPLALSVLKTYLDWLKYAPPGAANFHWNDATTAMQSGLAAMNGTFSSNAAVMADPDKSRAAGNLGYTYMPRTDGGADPVVPFGGWALAINADTKRVDASWEFLKWATGAEAQAKEAAINGTPMRYSALKDADAQKQFPWLPFILDAESKGYVRPDYRPRYPFWPKMEQAIGRELNLAAVGKQTAEDALTKSTNESTSIIKVAGFPVK